MRACLMLLLALAFVAPALAQDVPVPEPSPEARPDPEVTHQSGGFERLGVTGAVRAGYWSSTRNLDAESPLGAGMLWLKTSRRLSDGVSFLAEGWTSLRGPLEHGAAAGELRE